MATTVPAPPQAPITPNFRSSPETRATIRSFLYRQLFVVPPVPTGVSLDGKTAMVTGANTGIGLECARQLLELQVSRLILAVRNEAKGRAARADLLSTTHADPDSVLVWELDMESYDSIRHFVERARRTLDRLDIAVLNAGVMNQEHQLTAGTNHEQTLQVNVLSTAYLSIMLLPLLSATRASSSQKQPGRLVMVSSDWASWVEFEQRHATPLLEALDQAHGYHVFQNYGISKLLGQLFVSDLARRVSPSAVLITTANPGLVYGTGLGVVGNLADKIAAVPKRMIGRSPSVGARTLTDGVVNHGPEAHGQYLEDCEIQPMAPLLYQPEARELGDTLWAEIMSELAFAGAEQVVEQLRSA
ncbi:retinol dehydrogenase 12 [Xylariomycetidae sp. FL2044]|nr:retinol dehydrogenase 12 [Xylariomycetidae sp. FL2044]